MASPVPVSPPKLDLKQDQKAFSSSDGNLINFAPVKSAGGNDYVLPIMALGAVVLGAMFIWSKR